MIAAPPCAGIDRLRGPDNVSQGDRFQEWRLRWYPPEPLERIGDRHRHRVRPFRLLQATHGPNLGDDETVQPERLLYHGPELNHRTRNLGAEHLWLGVVGDRE